MLRRPGLWELSSVLLVFASPAWLSAQIEGVIANVQAVADEEFGPKPGATDDDDDDTDDNEDDDRVTQEITVELKQDGKTITVTETVEGEYVGEIVKGDETTDVRAGSVKELQEKFPDIHAAFSRKPANPLAKPGAQQNVNVQVTDNNGDRKVVAQEPGRKVTMHDKQGKEIEITVKHEFEGGTRTERYEAPHLDALRNKHPEIAQLFKQYRDGVIGFGGAVNLQVQAVPGGFNQAAAQPGGLGPRKIVGEHNGQQVVIKDEHGRNIRMTVTKTVDGEEVTEKFEAPDIATLKKQHKEIAAIYEKLAGKGVPQNQFGNVVIGNAGQGVRIQVQAQPVPVPVQAIPEPAERPAGLDAARQIVQTKRILLLAQQQLLRVSADPKFAEGEELKKLAEDVADIAKKLAELEEKTKK